MPNQFFFSQIKYIMNNILYVTPVVNTFDQKSRTLYTVKTDLRGQCLFSMMAYFGQECTLFIEHIIRL